ncbi:MAG: hypothetical protein WC505_05465 [Patescibacteria group bacterium]
MAQGPDTNIKKGAEQEPGGIEDIFDLAKEAKPPVPETTPEQPTAREVTRETPVEAAREARPEAIPEQEPAAESEDARLKYAPPPAAAATPAAAPAAKSEELRKIETVLSEHLDELFLQMTPEQQIAFQQKGEETASKIEKLMQSAKVKVREILSLIRDWLKIIPGVNKFFIEQEAKIKTDRLLAFHEQKHREK